MADEIYTIPEKPEYREQIRKLQDSDPASASRTFNPLIQRLVENAAAHQRRLEQAVTLEQVNEAIQKAIAGIQAGMSQSQADGRYLKLSGGSMTGTLYAQRNASYTTAQVRNIYFTTSDLTAGSTAMNDGDIAIVYE